MCCRFSEPVFVGSLWFRPPSSCARALPCVRPIVFIAAFYLRRTCGLHYFMPLHVYINHLRFHQALSHVCRMESVGRREELGDDTERKSQTTTADGEAPPFKLCISCRLVIKSTAVPLKVQCQIHFAYFLSTHSRLQQSSLAHIHQKRPV